MTSADAGSLSASIAQIRVDCDGRERRSMTTEQTDEVGSLSSLLSRIADGDAGAFAEFYDHTSPRVYGMVVRVLRDPGYSEETTQEVYLQVWRSADTFNPTAGSPMSWLMTLAHRRAVDRVRSETAADRREGAYGTVEYSASFDEVTEAVETRESGDEVRNCLKSLSDVQRESVDLAYYGGLTYREVAESLSVALPTVKSRIRDGLSRLRNCLGDRDV